MKMSKSSDDYLNLLFAQDSLLNSQEFEQHRAKIIERLNRAAERERRARKFTSIASVCCAALFFGIYWAAVVKMHSAALPDWLLYLLAAALILAPITALLLLALYFFRYRVEFLRARREARSQAMLEMPRQIADLRKELNDLRQQLVKERSDNAIPGKPEKAFTVLEMLMVVAIIGLLASLLLPGLAAAKAKGRTTICKNNLRQMGHALAMYESDFGFLPGCGDSLIATNNYPWDFPSTNSWIVRIQLYVGPNSDIFSCPDYEPHMDWKKTIKSDSFGYNAGGSSQIYADMDKNLGLGFGKDHFLRSTALAAPADMIELGDMQLPNSVWCNIISPWHKKPFGPIDCVIPSRHSRGAHMVFCDSHVEWQTQARWIDENIPARSRWNNDHQPHPETW